MVGRAILLCSMWLGWSITITWLEDTIQLSRGNLILVLIISGIILLIVTCRTLYNIAREDGSIPPRDKRNN